MFAWVGDVRSAGFALPCVAVPPVALAHVALPHLWAATRLDSGARG
jgi:hypothetical protein